MSNDGFAWPGVLLSFLLVLTRISVLFVFVPLPGIRSFPEVPRALVSLTLTVALYPVWPIVPGNPLLGQVLVWLISEAAFGLTVGVAVGFLIEGFVLAAQILGLQAGYSFASTIDPATQSDSTVLQTLVQLCAGLLFFAAGLDRELVRLFARSLQAWPPGSFVLTRPVAEIVRKMGGAMFSTGLRLAMPVVALMLLLDLSLALMGRVHAQLQLLSLSFPLKMLASLGTIAALLSVFPLVFAKAASETLTALWRLVS
jgi:flagellar biosynthesis protein FliR